MELEFLSQGMSQEGPQEGLQDEQNPGTNVSGLARSLNSDFDFITTIFEATTNQKEKEDIQSI